MPTGGDFSISSQRQRETRDHETRSDRGDSSPEKRRKLLDPRHNEGYDSLNYGDRKSMLGKYDSDPSREDHSRTAEGYEGEFQAKTRSGNEYSREYLRSRAKWHIDQEARTLLGPSYNQEYQWYPPQDAEPSTVREGHRDTGPSEQSDSTRRYDKDYANWTQEKLAVALVDKLCERYGHKDNGYVIKAGGDIRSYLLNERKLNGVGKISAKDYLNNIKLNDQRKIRSIRGTIDRFYIEE